jgi:glyoxylate reductase
MATRVLVTHPVPGGLEPLHGLDLVVRDDDAPTGGGKLAALLGEVDGVVCLLTDAIDEQVLAAGAGRLKVVANVAVGYDNIDVAAATERGVLVCNTPGVLNETTADLAFALMLSAARRASEAEADLRAGRWHGWGVGQYLGVDVHGATLGLIGYGRIGQAVARRAAGFGMRVLHHTRHDTGEPGWVAGLDELLAEADFVSLHVPLTDSTRHLISRDELSAMKGTAVLINTARGPVVDEAALADSLAAGELFAAGLDVYEDEPQVHPRLAATPQAVLLPHIGSASWATRTRMVWTAAQAARDALEGERPQTAVNPEVWRAVE